MGAFPDVQTWSVRLREGIRWHDGVPVTAHDVKFTLDLLQHPDTLLAESNYTVSALDPSPTITSTCLTRVRWTITSLVGLSICLKCWIRNKSTPGTSWQRPVGCGPYRHVRTVPETMMEFEANPDHAYGKPKIENVILKFGGTS